MSEFEVLTDQELADEWKVPRRAIQKLCRAGVLRAFKVGVGQRALWRITRQAVTEYTSRDQKSRAS